VLDITASDRFYLVYLHDTPSRGRTLLVNRELKLAQVLDGWVLKVYDDDTVVYHRGQVHFAPVHPAEISVYQPDRGQTKDIFPPHPYQPLWREHMDQLRQAYEQLGDDWCREHNHPCDPELFDSSINGENMAVNDATDSLALLVTFGGWQAEAFSGEVITIDETEAVYVYRGVRDGDPLEYRELSRAAVQQLLNGAFRLDRLLEQPLLDKIFDTIPFNSN
ncbi:MAG: hypothetical protein AB1801_02385, partial [Chloroflexota bacterium]